VGGSSGLISAARRVDGTPGLAATEIKSNPGWPRIARAVGTSNTARVAEPIDTFLIVPVPTTV
jgi:hypothetical protein